MAQICGFSFINIIGICVTLYYIASENNVTAKYIDSENQKYTCLYNKIYYDGGTKFKPEPCMTCHCPKIGGEARCAIQDCMFDASCLNYDREEGECCGVCIERGCRHSDGKLYKMGTIVESTGCETCYCTDTGQVVCRGKQCPRTECVDAVLEKDGCCKTCPRGPNCYLGKRVIPFGKMIMASNCRLCQCPPGPLPEWMTETGNIQAICSIGDCS